MLMHQAHVYLEKHIKLCITDDEKLFNILINGVKCIQTYSLLIQHPSIHQWF